VEAQWTYGFCRHAPEAQTALVILSNLPWHETFYGLLNHAAELTLAADGGELWRFLRASHEMKVPDDGGRFSVCWTSSNGAEKDFACASPPPDGLPRIPENVSKFEAGANNVDDTVL